MNLITRTEKGSLLSHAEMDARVAAMREGLPAATFADPGAMLASALTYAGGVAAGDRWRAGPHDYVVAAAGASDHHLITSPGGVKLYFQRNGPSVSPEAFGAAGDGVTDDIAALERWRDYVEAHGLIGMFDGRTYMVSRTFYLVAVASYEGCEGSCIKATAGFATTFVDPERDHLAAGLAPVVFFDGRIEATGAPNRRVGLSGFAIDAGSVAAHGLIAAGVGAGNLKKVHVDNATVAHFVLCGVQNADVEDLKAIGGDAGALPSRASLMILNGAKNTALISCDLASADDDTPTMLEIHADANYPGPGNSASAISDGPSGLTFVKGVVETQGNSLDPLRAIWVRSGENLTFIDYNPSGGFSLAMAEIEAGVNGVRFIGGRWNGLNAATKLLINEGRGVCLDRCYISNLTGSGELIENNGVGVVTLIEQDNGLFHAGNLFAGTAAHHQEIFVPRRIYGDAAAKTAARADEVTGTPWWDSDHNLMTLWVNGAALRADGGAVPSGTSDEKSWPTLTESAITAGVLDPQGYRFITLTCATAQTITNISMTSGDVLWIKLGNANTTFNSNSNQRTVGRVPVTPGADVIMGFVKAGSIVSQFAGPGGLVTASAVNLGDAAHAINTIVKHGGKLVRNTTDSKLYIATGASTTSTWVSADGATTITPA